METPGFARLENSVPVTADIGVAWPILASALREHLDVKLDFLSAPQESEEGMRMREWIVSEAGYAGMSRMYEEARHILFPEKTSFNRNLLSEFTQ